MKVHKIKSVKPNSKFEELSCKDKIKVLKRLVKGKKRICGCIIEPTNSIEDKYNKICQCINTCSSKEIAIIEVELKNGKKSFGNLGRFKEFMIPLFLSMLSLIIACSELTGQSIDSNAAVLTMSCTIIAIVVLCYLIDFIVNKGISTSEYILEIIEKIGEGNKHAAIK